MVSTSFDSLPLRQQFPALHQEVNGYPATFLDGPGGTQVPQRVIDAISNYLAQGSSNHGGPFLTSRRTDEMVDAAREAMKDLFNARRPEEIVFGQNMTSLTLAMSRAIARTWQPGDEIVVTRLDHDANIAPWLLAAGDRGVTVRWLDFRPEDCTLALDRLPGLLNEKTRLVAVTYASNAVGSITDVRRVAQLAHQVGALVYVDAVHYAPHGLIDVQELDCDFLACSAYKFFGTHTGVLYGKYEWLDELTAYKVRPAPAAPPGKWETGTQSFESLAGVTAAVEYLASIGGREGSRRERLVRAMGRIKAYEMGLSEHFLREAPRVPGLRVYGITDVERLDQRAPTFAVSLEGYPAGEVAARLGEQGIFVWSGHYYAIAAMERLGLLDRGGLVRIGLVHYNTREEIDRVLAALTDMAR
ncbi:MAG: cysteine desulfurase-like protein [Chloroflexi bacterium]|nr:cysteine desulfurase-like protein [Chloroflexota bacterium]MCI0575876.1 cysteine desulfurase-like protein [Chloroflexota bacterium]MCI0648898.1 cysteine desulfurase-like protein [Chloroflexota bacterium]MCI0725838.1 cysteine desulfurase-like protein [Chloroflexota bacterium]